VLIFDYRSFGGSINCCSSSSNVRNHINPWDHVQDIESVIAWIKSSDIPFVNASAIGLWGTSFAGGHMLVVGEHLKNDSSIKAVVSQVPHLSGKVASFKSIQLRGVLGSIKVVLFSLSDMLSSSLGLGHIYVKIVGQLSDTLAYMILEPAEFTSYNAKHPPSLLGGWKNLAPARTLLMMSMYNPIESVPGVAAPVLFVGASQDTLCPAEVIQAAYFMV
jgi:predicted alpha/beta hydrolase